MQRERLGRRHLIARGGLALGGLVTLGALQACGEEESTTPSTPTPKVSEFPYEQHIAAGYQLDPAVVQEAAYQAYYAGGCCHGAYSALVGHLASTVGAPFDQLPIDFGKFGAGGIDGYGSICGSALGATLVINMIVKEVELSPNVWSTYRKNLTWELLRWYEEYAFPVYVPETIHSLESTTLSFTGGTPVMTPVAPGSHLCHASVSKWCRLNGVSAGSGDKKARCARLTADVAGKAAQLINAYLAATPRAFSLAAYDPVANPDPNSACDACHTAGSATNPSVAADMTCVSCHDPVTHP